MDERGDARYGDTTICYSVVRSLRRKKTIEIRLDAARGVMVTAPVAASFEDIHDLVLKRAAWIITRSKEGVAVPERRLYAAGETLPYGGRDIPVKVAESEAASVGIRLIGSVFAVTVPMRLQGEERREAIHRAFLSWYRRRAIGAVRRSVALWSAQMGLVPSSVKIRDQRQRWGSCSPNGTLRFNWRIVMAETCLLDYVVVHELAHLAQANHSPNFWAVVERYMPDYRQRRRRLKEAGRHYFF
jgi:predicted metal-dependent hydrolase